MSKTVLALFAACVGLSLLSLHLVKQLRAGQTTITELQAQVAKLESDRKNTPPSPAPAATWQVEPVTPPATPAKEVVTGVSMKVPRVAANEETNSKMPAREERLRMMREARERQRQLMQDPEYREAMRLQQRSNMTRQYPGLARALGLTDDQAEQLFDLLAEQQLRNNEQAELQWDPEGLDPADRQQLEQNLRQRWMELQKKSEAELAAQLGPDKLQAWKEYQSTLGARHQAEQLRSTLAGRGVALTDEASRAVVKAYSEAQKIEMQELNNQARANAAAAGKAGLTSRIYATGSSPEMLEQQIEHTRRRNQRVLEALSPYLTYEQREALEKEQDAELKMQEAQIRLMRAQSNVDSANSSQTFFLPDQ